MLYDYSKQIIQTYDALHSKLQEIKDIISGTIRVATIYSIGLHDLPPYLKKFLKSYPTVNVHVEYRRANQVYEDVLGNVVDLGLVAYPTRDSKLEICPAAQGPAGADLPPAASARQEQEHPAQGHRRPEVHQLRAGHPHAQGAGQDPQGTLASRCST